MEPFIEEEKKIIDVWLLKNLVQFRAGEIKGDGGGHGGTGAAFPQILAELGVQHVI